MTTDGHDKPVKPSDIAMGLAPIPEPAYYLQKRANGDNIVELPNEPTPWHGQEEHEPPSMDGYIVNGHDWLWAEQNDPTPVWGDTEGGEILWAGGEPLLLAGGIGVGKTTVLLQLLRCRLGLETELLRWQVQPGKRNTLYFASDRPKQIAKALRRTTDRTENLDRLKIMEGPPPFNIVDHPDGLLQLALAADADTVLIDSIKDLVSDLSSEQVGFAINRAFQLCVTNGIEIAANHHTRKASGENKKPNTLADIYGSTWITAGAGSVMFLYGNAGDAEVEMLHLKQPEAKIEDLKMVHDHEKGRSTVLGGWDPLAFLHNKSDGDTTAKAAAKAMTNKIDPTRAEEAKARRKLDKLVTKGLATKTEGVTGGTGGTVPVTYQAVELEMF